MSNEDYKQGFKDGWKAAREELTNTKMVEPTLTPKKQEIIQTTRLPQPVNNPPTPVPLPSEPIKWASVCSQCGRSFSGGMLGCGSMNCPYIPKPPFDPVTIRD